MRLNVDVATLTGVKTLFVLNDPAYGTERSYNGLRLANALVKRENEEVRVFLVADAVAARSPASRHQTATTTSSA